jgi:hypothetical protein
VTGPVEPESVEAFAASRELFETVLGWLAGQQAAGTAHGELEARLQTDAREAFRQMFQDKFDLRAAREQRIDLVVDADQVAHPSAEASHTRGLATVFGRVRVTRIAYRARGRANLHPADGVLNLSHEEYSRGLRRLAAVEASPRFVRRGGRGYRTGHRTTGRQTAGRTTRPPICHRRRRVLPRAATTGQLQQ